MEKVTIAVLYEMIKSIKEDTVELKGNNKNQWKEINKNAQAIAGIKGASGAIAGFVSLIIAVISSYFFGSIKH